MGRIRQLCAVCALLLAAGCLFAACKTETGTGTSGESTAVQSSASEEPKDGSDVPAEDEDDEDPLPPPEAIVLLYTDYLTVRTEQDGLEYEYTYCFDAEQAVFNALAVIRFPTEEAAKREYDWLRRNSYPNLELEGCSLSFCFPKKECPFYGISYRALEVLLEETVYEIVDSHPPTPPESPAEGDNA